MTVPVEPRPPSLAEQAGRALRGLGRQNGQGGDPVPAESELVLDAALTPAWVGWVVAALIAAGPLLTIAGAEWLRARTLAETSRLETAHAPAHAAAARAAEARAVLRGTLTGPALGVTLDTLAAALPAEDRLAAASADGSGALRLEIATVDPDRLRAALRRSRLSGLRETGQARGEGVLLVRWEGRPG